ncbi:MAG: hypothetical protein BWX79_03008 [Alphaproteobacteria bacterium ADurb.Bin100]|nr:MAG: hypothetical protein BWX79_03008 [Alphaproteobacteria bacterium ADurb.Bin100]
MRLSRCGSLTTIALPDAERLGPMAQLLEPRPWWFSVSGATDRCAQSTPSRRLSPPALAVAPAGAGLAPQSGFTVSGMISLACASPSLSISFCPTISALKLVEWV